MEGRKSICKYGDDDSGVVEQVSACNDVNDGREAREKHVRQDSRDKNEEGNMGEWVDGFEAIEH